MADEPKTLTIVEDPPRDREWDIPNISPAPSVLFAPITIVGPDGGEIVLTWEDLARLHALADEGPLRNLRVSLGKTRKDGP